MNNHDRKTIQKMIEHCNHIIDYMKDCESIDDFEKNTMLVEAVVFNLVQLGELAHTELSDEAKKEMNQIPWKQVYGMRNRIVHGYEDIRLSVVWETAKHDIKELETSLKAVANIK